MKRVSNLSTRLAVAGSAIGAFSLLLAPVGAYAIAANPTQPAPRAVATTTPKLTKTSPFCTNLPSRASAITDKVTAQVGKVNQTWTLQNQKQVADYQKFDQTISANRLKVDNERNTDFSKLEARATTPAQQQAVQTYVATVKSNVATRRSAYDTARGTFRSAVIAALSTRRTSVTSQLDSFQSSVNGAIGSAEASCTADPTSSTTVRQSLVTSLKTARESFKTDRAGDLTVTSQIKQLAATRTASFKTADQTFKSSMTTARQTLQTAFGKKTV